MKGPPWSDDRVARVRSFGTGTNLRSWYYEPVAVEYGDTTLDPVSNRPNASAEDPMGANVGRGELSESASVWFGSGRR